MKWVKRTGVVLITVVALGAVWMYFLLHGSLPDLDGELELTGLSAPVIVERDALGVPTLRGDNRLDVVRALGFLHGQERFFQMDLMRRRAAGELAELFGADALPLDRRHRIHRMRARAQRSAASAAPTEKTLLDVYVQGVNAGIDALEAAPFEYLLLRQPPRPWLVEDSLLVVASMYFELNDADGQYESTLGLLNDVLAPELASFLSPVGTGWDAPVDGDPLPMPPVPGPSAMRATPAFVNDKTAILPDEGVSLGSNNWAVAGERSAHGGALLANDPHLGHSVPNIWYRAVLRAGSNTAIGATLPGTPFVVTGSNTRVAWGFTNTNGDWVDLIELETSPDHPDAYRTSEGWTPFSVSEELVQDANGEPESFTVRETIWGPVIDEDHEGRLRALRWIAHDVDGINMTLGELETATSLDEALAIAQRSGMPPQNFVCADDAGAIAWTVAGRIPKRYGFDGRLPSSWADGTRGWDGWLAPEDYPVIRNPETGIIWTANARVVSGEMLAKLGDGGYDFGARARQIRGALLELEDATEQDMLGVQLDDRALFMDTWRGFLLEWIDDDELRRVLDNDWSGRASTDSVSYRIVRELRLAIYEEVLNTITEEAHAADARFSIWAQRQWEGPVWKLVTEKPEHVVPPPYENWNAWMNDIVRRTVASWDEPLESRTWGATRMSDIRHPLSPAVPFLSRWLDMPSRPLPGDSHMPRVQSRTHGASERFVVSPGREDEGLFHMPGGQAGHPMSPYYGAGHDDWEQGRPTPLLPGPTHYTLTLR